MKPWQWCLIIGAVILLATRRSSFSGLSGSGDISVDEDLAYGVMHLISLEEHLLASYQQTGNRAFLTDYQKAREQRRQAMQQLLPYGEAQNWCASKHCLGGAMRFLEVAAKKEDQGDAAGAQDALANASQLFSLFKNRRNSAQTGPQAPCRICQQG